MQRWLFFVYGATCHLLFLVTFAALAGFVGDFGLPKTVDTPAVGSLGTALMVNLALVAIFAAQHSIMARPAFKRVWTRFVPQPIERSTYVLASCLVTALLMWQWRGIDAIVWDVRQPLGRATLWTLFVAGWLLVPLVSLLIHHFDLFGTRQVWLHLRGEQYSSLPFRTPLFYRFVRHPLYIGWAIAFWAIPTMTVGHLIFAGTMTVYMGLAAVVEERDLVNHFGRVYTEYRQRVGMFVPRMQRSAKDVVIEEVEESVLSA